ncbi:MAG: methylmalonyl Co-A mutase-associated GTPase MeaB, partial [Chloroflexota bacterium]
MSGDVRTAGRLMSHMEDDAAMAAEVARIVHPRGGQAHVIGVTGPPGAGKSSLLNALAGCLRQQHRQLGIVAVDPSSPLSGGALLGDRIRLQEHFGEGGPFIRSMSSRGHNQGLARAAFGVVELMDAMGYPVVALETVGAGQAAIDALRIADTVLLVLAPGLGDAVQAMKAGLLELADVVVVNKADHAEAEEAARDVRASLAGHPTPEGWAVPVLTASAAREQGIEQLLSTLNAHRAHLAASGAGDVRRQHAAAAAVQAVLADRLADT